jgi:hypothetical protein
LFYFISLFFFIFSLIFISFIERTIHKTEIYMLKDIHLIFLLLCSFCSFFFCFIYFTSFSLLFSLLKEQYIKAKYMRKEYHLESTKDISVPVISKEGFLTKQGKKRRKKEKKRQNFVWFCFVLFICLFMYLFIYFSCLFVY